MNRFALPCTLSGIMLTCLLATPLYAGEQSVKPKDSSAEQQRWAAFPVIGSSPETGLMLGGMLFHFFPVDEPGKQASTIDAIAFGTTKGQYLVQLSPNIFLDSGRYRVNATLGESIWQANYYGIGANSPNVAEKYKSTSLQGSLTLERRFNDAFVLDLLGVHDNDHETIIDSGALQTGNVLGASGGTYNGMGIEGGYDTRDNDMLAVQSEFRAPIHGRFSGTVFAEAAQVVPNFAATGGTPIITSVGVGFRYALNPSQRFNVRGDLAWVDHGLGMIINVREAF